MKPKTDSCDINVCSRGTAGSSKISNSQSKLETSKRRKKLVLNGDNFFKNKKSDSPIPVPSNSHTSSNVHDVESDADSNSDARLKLIKELIRKRKNQLEFTDTEDDESEDSEMSEEEFLNKRERNGTRSLYKIKQLRNLPDYSIIAKILNGPGISSYHRRYKSSFNAFSLKKHTRPDHWSTYKYLRDRIEKFILNNEWNNLTKALILLADAPKSYKPFFLKATLINILCNPATKQDEYMLENFLKSSFSCHSDRDMEKVLSDLFHIKTDFDEICNENEENED